MSTSDLCSKPAVKRTYGSRQVGGPSRASSSRSASDESAFSSSSSSSSASSAPHKRARSAGNSTPSDGADVSLTYTSTSQSSSSSSDPPTPPSSKQRNVNTGKSTTLLPARRRLLQQQESSTSKGKEREVSKAKSGKKLKLEQMHLAFSTAPLSMTCKKCAMAYMRGSVDDEELHKKYCKKAASGVDWPASMAQSSETSRVVHDGIVLGKGKEQLEASIWMVEGSSGGSIAKKLAEISETVDQSLSAASLSSEQVSASKYVILLAKPADSLSKSRKVIGCAIVERVQEAHRVVAKGSDRSKETDLLRFGEDEGAIFCSPVSTPALLGIHRIWTSPSHRRLGIAAHLLDAIAEHAIYGRVIRQEDRQDTVAFSQPSDAGRQLFAAWTGTREFLVFVD